MSLHALLFAALFVLNINAEQVIHPPQIVEVATLLLPPEQPKLAPPAPQQNARPAPAPAIKQAKVPSKAQAKPKDKPKLKIKAKPADQSPLKNEMTTNEPPPPSENLTSGKVTNSAVTSTSAGNSKAITGEKGSANSGPVIPADYRSAKLDNPPTRYPRRAMDRGLQGLVKLRVQVLTNGHAGEIRVQTSSGSDLLDQSAIEQVGS